MEHEHRFYDIEHRLSILEKYASDQKTRSASFGKRFAALEQAVANLQKTVGAMPIPQHQHVPKT